MLESLKVYRVQFKTIDPILIAASDFYEVFHRLEKLRNHGIENDLVSDEIVSISIYPLQILI